jgi:hypothetical protein
MKRRTLAFLPVAAVLVTLSVVVAHAWTAVPVTEDPLVRMPGTQPGQVALEGAGRCLNCHADYNTAAEPGYNWKGSMMAQSARDFLFWACLTVAGQDSVWALGTPNAVDICERCHFPKGWLEGRSDPPNGSAVTGDDYDGVQCDFCHAMFDPFFEATYDGTREGSDWLGYWDEMNGSDTPSQPAADATYAEDAIQAGSISLFNEDPFYDADNTPFSAAYIENGAGQYFVSANGDKRASFADADARHQMLYSRYHKSKYFCSTCHDVSNPALANLGQDGTLPLTTETDSAYSYFHVERTFSEFMLSAYGQQGGAPTNPAFQAQGAPNITAASTCQDCHMRDVVGVACDKNGVPIRPDDSVEHPNSGQPLHDMTGGNMWVSAVLASAVPGSANYDATNDALLNQGPDVLTLDLGQGEGIDPAALLAGVERARQQLLLAATIKNVGYDPNSGDLSFQIQNNTGHKLISGFPEGRRMFVNVRAYADGSLIHEVNPYDPAVGTLKGLPIAYSPNSPVTSSNEVYFDELVYEMHPSSTLTGEDKTFHFALATGRYKDNRIPPKGFDIASVAERLSVPVWNGVEAPDYFSAEEYAGGYDDVSLAVAPGADYVEVNLYYQITSREYIEFLRDEVNGTGNLTLTGTGAGDDAPYIVQTDPFFDQLKAWGDTIWQLWTHNMETPGAAPFLMAQATVGDTNGGCDAPSPALLSAAPGHKEVTLDWSEESADTSVVGYRIYYDQGGKAQPIAQITDPTVTAFTDTGLSNGVNYCYKVTSYYSDACESSFSNILCATPTPELPPGVFSKASPADGATAQPTDPTLSWATSQGATNYEYCIDATDEDTCDVGWTSTGTNTSVSLSGLSEDATYYWQIRARNAAGTTEADIGLWWHFTTAPAGSVGPLIYNDHAVDDDASTSNGDDDGIVECGETIELNVTLKNQGTATATEVVATLSTSDPYVTITDSVESFPDIPGGGTSQDIDDYDFQVADNVPAGDAIRFHLGIKTSGGGPWSDLFYVEVQCVSPASDDFRVYVPAVFRGAD